MTGEIINKVFFEVELFAYHTEENIIRKRPIAFLVVETNDPETTIMPIGVDPGGEWFSMEAYITKKDQRNLRCSETSTRNQDE